MATIKKEAPLGFKDVFLTPLKWCESYASWEEIKYTCYASEMEHPAYAPFDGNGFYSIFWPDQWEKVKDAVKRAFEDVGKRGFVYYEPEPRELWGSKILSVPSRPDMRWTRDGEPVDVLEVDPSFNWVYPGLDLVPESLLDWLREKQNCLANFMPLPMELVKARLSDREQMPDVFLEMLRRWFAGEQLDSTDIGRFDDHCDYFKEYGEGEEGWRAFVDRNFLLGNFVNEDYSVRVLFERDSALLDRGCSFAKTKEQADMLVSNVSDCWDRRAGLLADTYKEILLSKAHDLQDACRKHGKGSASADLRLEELEEAFVLFDATDCDPMHELLANLICAAGADVAMHVAFEDLRRFERLSRKYDSLQDHGIHVDLDVESLDVLARRIDAEIDKGELFSIYFDPDIREWRIRNSNESDDLTYIASEFCRTCLIYEFDYVGEEPRYYKGERYYNHQHSFDDLLADVVRNPLLFYIPEECKELYSQQELNLIEQLRNKLLS